MTNLILVRHGESEGNKMRIIQGKMNIFSLTQEGRRQVKESTLSNIKLLKEINGVYSSSMMRAIETAKIVIKTAGIEQEVQSMEILDEMDPGVLSGKTHDYAKENMPKEYAIWTQYKDLDGIERAETGDELQARAIAFLEYMLHSCEQGNYVVVTHAGFLRCLYNTILNKDRTTPVDISNACFHKVDAFKYFSPLVIKEGEKCSVSYISTCNGEYVIKHINRLLTETELLLCKVQNRVSKKNSHITEVLFAQNMCLAENTYGLKISRYIDGEHDFQKYDYHKSIEIYKQVEKIYCDYNDEIRKEKSIHLFKEISLLKKTKLYLDKLRNCETKQLGIILTEHKEDEQYDSSQFGFIIYDLHRRNIIFANDSLYFIDIESVLYSPREYQVASYIVSFMMLNDYGDSEKATEKFINYICLKCGYRKSKIIFLSLWRVFTGLSYFELLIEKSENDKAIVSDYWKVFTELMHMYEDENVNPKLLYKLKMLLRKCKK